MQAPRTNRARRWRPRMMALCGAFFTLGMFGVTVVPANATTTTFQTTASVNVRSGPGTSYSVIAGEGSGASFTLTCQWQGGTNVNGNSTWDRAQFANGVVGAISDYWTTTSSFNSFQPGFGPCGSSHSNQYDAAMAWATSRSGSTAYHGLCLQFVDDAMVNGGIPITRYSSATAAWNDALYTRHTAHPGDLNPPRGALVFWSGIDASTGHVGIAKGDGTFIATDVAVNYTAIGSAALPYFANYWGWAPAA